MSQSIIAVEVKRSLLPHSAHMVRIENLIYDLTLAREALVLLNQPWPPMKTFLHLITFDMKKYISKDK